MSVIATMSTSNRRWDDCEPEFVLVGHIVHLACKDALQTKNDGLHKEAWDFLDSFAPDIAQRLRTKQQSESKGSNYDSN